MSQITTCASRESFLFELELRDDEAAPRVGLVGDLAARGLDTEYIHWTEFVNPAVYQCLVWVTRADEGGFCAFAPKLPGVVSEGPSEEAAIAGLREALQGSLRSYLAHQESIPWSDEPIDVGAEVCLERWIVVDA